MTSADVAAIAAIRQETVDFVKEAIENYCRKNGLTINHPFGQGFPRRKKPTDQLNCIMLTKERCSWQYPGLDEEGHFHSGVVLTVCTSSDDEHGPNYVVIMLVPEHFYRVPFSTIDLSRLQDESGQKVKWTDIIHDRIRQAMDQEEKGLEKYKKVDTSPESN